MQLALQDEPPIAMQRTKPKPKSFLFAASLNPSSDVDGNNHILNLFQPVNLILNYHEKEILSNFLCRHHIDAGKRIGTGRAARWRRNAIPDSDTR